MQRYMRDRATENQFNTNCRVEKCRNGKRGECNLIINIEIIANPFTPEKKKNEKMKKKT